MANLSLVFDLIGRDVSASRAFKGVGDSAERAGKQGESFGGLVSKGLKLASGALLGAGIIEGFKSLYDAAAESAKIGRLTEQVIKSTGGTANVTAKQVGDLAAAISAKTGVDDEAIQSGQNLLLTFTKVRNEVGAGNDIFNQATGTITDMSVALGQDTSSSAIQLGKALNDPIKGVTALQKVGVSFTQSQKDQIRTLVEAGDVMGAQKVILAELGKEFGGAAEAAATPFDKLKVNLGNLAETLGNNLIPYVNDFANFMMDDVLPAVQDVGGVVSGSLGPALGLAVDLFKGLFDTVGSVVRWFADLPGPVQAAAVALGAMAVLKGPLGSLFDTLRDTAQTAALRALYLKDSISGLGGAGGVAKAGLGGLTGFFGGPWGLALTGATVGLSLLTSWLGKSDKATENTRQATEDYASALRSANGVINESVRQSAAKAAQDAGILDIAKKVGIALPDVTSAITDQGGALTRTRDQLEAFIASHTRLVMVQTGKGGAPIATEQLDSEGKAALGALDALNKLSGQTGITASDAGQLAEATGVASEGMGTAALTAEQFKAGLQDTADAADDARKSTDLFKGALDQLTGAAVDITEVESAFWEELDKAKTALEGATGAVLDHAGGLNLQSDAGRKTRDTLVGLASDADAWISTMRTQGASTDDLRAKDAQLRTAFYNTALQMTGNKDAAQALTDKYYGIPGQRNTLLTADASQAIGQVSALQEWINGLHDKRVTITAVGVHVQGAGGGGNILERASGGLVTRNQLTLVGERGPELVRFGGSGFVTPAEQTKRMLQGASSGSSQSSPNTPIVQIERFESGGQSPMEVAEALSWMARTRG